MPVTPLQPIRQPSVSRAMQNALAIQGAETRNLLAEKQLGTFDETQEAVRAQRAREQETHEMLKSVHEFNKSQDPAKRMENFDKMLRITLNRSTYATHDAAMKYLQGVTKGDFSTVPTAGQIQEMALKAGRNPEQYYEEVWKPDTLSTWEQKSRKEIAKIAAEGKAPRAVKAYVGPEGDIKYIRNNEIPPEGYVPYSTGMDIEVGPEGTRIRTGVRPGEAGDLTRKTKGALEDKLRGAQEQLVRLNAIESEYQEEFSEIGTRLGAAWTGIKAKFGRDVSPEDATRLTSFKKWQRKAIENINLYIKELTGAQMSEKEANRLRLAQPDPGENWWQGDDPITFKAKMDDAKVAARAAISRYKYYQAKGLGDTEILRRINLDEGDPEYISLESLISKMGK